MLNLKEHMLTELAEEFRDDWQLFLKYIRREKGTPYLRSMLRAIENAISKNWLGNVNGVFEDRRGAQVIKFNKQYPEYIKYVRRILRQKYGDSFVLYRGMSVKIEELTKKNAQARKFIDGAKINIKSYKGHKLFSWTHDKEVKNRFMYGSDRGTPVTLTAQVPVSKIVWCGLPVAKVYDDVTDAEFIVNHGGQGIQAEVSSNLKGFGEDKYGRYMISRYKQIQQQSTKLYFMYDPAWQEYPTLDISSATIYKEPKTNKYFVRKEDLKGFGAWSGKLYFVK